MRLSSSLQQAPERALLAARVTTNSGLVLIIAGPTASGKTDLAVALSREVPAEIISADSRAVYRGLDAGTAKPPRAPDGLVDGVPYHLLDRLDPREAFDAGTFARESRALCGEILNRGRLPIVAGGTGFYLSAFLHGLAPLPRGSAAIRERLLEESARRGRAWLHERLQAADPRAAAAIPKGNIHRTIRALEVAELSGRPISELWEEARPEPLPCRSLLAAIRWTPAELRRRIEERSRRIWPGILAETQALMEKGYSGAEPGFQSLGYREAVSCLRGEKTRESGLEDLQRRTLAYAKRQRTYLRNKLSALEIEGGPIPDMTAQVLSLLRGFGAGSRE